MLFKVPPINNLSILDPYINSLLINQHIVHLKLIQYYMSIYLNKAEKKYYFSLLLEFFKCTMYLCSLFYI